jgi:hypothetical protein
MVRGYGLLVFHFTLNNLLLGRDNQFHWWQQQPEGYGVMGYCV